MKKILIASIILFFYTTATAQFGLSGGGIIGSTINKKKEKKQREAQEKTAQESAIKDSTEAADKLATIAKDRQEHKQYYDSLDRVQVMQQQHRDSVAIAKKQYRDSIDKKNSTAWGKVDMDSVKFMDSYGSENEYALQEAHAAESRTKYNVFLIGAKSGFSFYLVTYLKRKGWAYTNTRTAQALKFKLTRYDDESNYNEVMNLNFTLDKNKRITHGVITGTSRDVIDLFVNYWSDCYSTELPNSNGSYKNNASDKITLTLTGGTPVITLTNGPFDFNLGQYEKKKG